MPTKTSVCTHLTLLIGLSVWCCVIHDVESVLHNDHRQAKVSHKPVSYVSVEKLSEDRSVSDALRHVEQLLLTQSLQLRQYERRLQEQEELIMQQSSLLSQHESRIAVLENKNQPKDPIASTNDHNGEYDPAVGSISKVLHESSEDKLGKIVKYGEKHRNNTWSVKNSGPPRAARTIDSTYQARRVQERADDNGPLEAVLNQLTQQVTAVTADLLTLKASSQQQSMDLQDARSSAFVRWGSSSCPGTSQLVYSGVVGGSYEEHSGAETNYLCLTTSPVFASRPLPQYYGYLFGGEYETSDPASDQRDPVCAVCCSSFATTVMIPGTNVCTPGWHLQYSGYLMGGYYGHAAGSEYVCVDAALESYPHSEVNQNGKLFFFTVTNCGSLPCGPYVNGKVVTCAVCSK